jgi:hypothetical protein
MSNRCTPMKSAPIGSLQALDITSLIFDWVSLKGFADQEVNLLPSLHTYSMSQPKSQTKGKSLQLLVPGMCIMPLNESTSY